MLTTEAEKHIFNLVAVQLCVSGGGYAHGNEAGERQAGGAEGQGVRGHAGAGRPEDGDARAEHCQQGLQIHPDGGRLPLQV